MSKSPLDQGPEGPDPIDVAVGHRIRVRRKSLGISQSTLAEHLGVSFQQVQKYERGANRVSASMLVKIAQKIKTTVAELVGETAVTGPADETLNRQLALPGAIKLLGCYEELDPKSRTAVLELADKLGPAS